MATCVSRVASIIALAAAANCWALDQERLWLPKSYQSAMPKLLAVAREAEATHRCTEVVAGRMLLDKNTDRSYYFLITCRSDGGQTYNLGYRAPVNGDTPELVTEQRLLGKPGEGGVADNPQVTPQQALDLCHKGFSGATANLDDVTAITDKPLKAVTEKGGFQVTIPFTTQSELGHRVLRHADCHVNWDGDTRYGLVLEEAGARAICVDQLRTEAALLGFVTIYEKDTSSVADTDGGFHLQIPFDASSSNSGAVRYMANCKVDTEGNSSVALELQPQGAVTLCIDELKMDTLMRENVAIADPLSVTSDDKGFAVELAYNADDADGESRKFLAHCQVDHKGEANVTTELDKSAIIPVCKGGVIHETRNMLSVKILDGEVPPLQQDGDGYLGIIPFDAEDPGGHPLHYKAECRVDDSGNTRIKIKAR